MINFIVHHFHCFKYFQFKILKSDFLNDYRYQQLSKQMALLFLIEHVTFD